MTITVAEAIALRAQAEAQILEILIGLSRRTDAALTAAALTTVNVSCVGKPDRRVLTSFNITLELA